MSTLPSSGKPPYPSPFLRQLTPEDQSTVASLEHASYPSDEAASLSAVSYRLEHAANVCHALIMPPDDKLIGFVLSTCTTHVGPMQASSMHVHESDGDTLCIHSVVIAEEYRRQGLGLILMNMYINRIREIGPIKKVRLLAKRTLVQFYQKANFEVLGVSAIVHGQDEWIEMVKELV